MVLCSFHSQRTLGEIGAKMPNMMQDSTRSNVLLPGTSFPQK